MFLSKTFYIIEQREYEILVVVNQPYLKSYLKYKLSFNISNDTIVFKIAYF